MRLQKVCEAVRSKIQIS